MGLAQWAWGLECGGRDDEAHGLFPLLSLHVVTLITLVCHRSCYSCVALTKVEPGDLLVVHEPHVDSGLARVLRDDAAADLEVPAVLENLNRGSIHHASLITHQQGNMNDGAQHVMRRY